MIVEPSKNMQVPSSSPDDIVISGMSGTFPGSRNIEEFEYKLYNKIDMVSKETRCEIRHLDQPERAALIPENNQFDCGFFGIHKREEEYMEPSIRLLLEKCAETIFDAGLHPDDLENTRTGVYVGSCVSESAASSYRKPKPENCFFFTGNISNMMANRISYFYKLRGPSFLADTACSSSLYCLEHAYNAMKRGEIDMAIVAGANLCPSIETTVQFKRLGVLSLDGICKVFDQKANGYVRAEGISTLLLQKQKDAKRIYCTVVHAKTNCDGYKEEGITYPSREAQTELLKEFYNECGISPDQLSYLEAHGTGTKVGDPEECDAIDTVFTINRDRPLLMGSVKSCVGHSEPVSGCISVVKSILALEKGEIAPNLHFNTPNPDIKGIIEGRIKVVNNVTKFDDDRGLIGINGFGFGGGNCHVLIKGHRKTKVNFGISKDNLPRLVCYSGRTEESVRVLDDYISRVGSDAEFIGLLHNIFRKNIANHMYRGYTIISKKGVLETSLNDGNFAPWHVPPVNILFGELDNWYELLKNFSEVEIFNDTLKRVQIVMTSSINLKTTILNENEENRKSHDILGNIITQICIVNLLKSLKLAPKETAGYSIGALIHAYYNENLKLEEVLKCAYIFNSKITKNEMDKSSFHNSTSHHVDRTHHLRKDLSKNILNVLNKPNVRNGQPASLEHLIDAILKKTCYKSENFIKSDTVVLEIGRNNLEINEHDYESIKWMTMPETFQGFLRVFGSLYLLGYNLAVEKLYPTIQFPVSRGTPQLSSKITWNHHQTFERRKFFKKYIQIKSFTIDLRKTEWSFISGHMIDGRILFPASGYLFITWQVLADKYEIENNSLPIIFESVKFIRATPILPTDPVVLVVAISNSGYFQITEKDSIVVTGHIKEVVDQSKVYHKSVKPMKNEHMMNNNDIYQELRLRGYNYQGEFQALESCDIAGHRGKIQWTENYITFIDNLFQLQIMHTDSRLLYVPTYLSRASILPKIHQKFISRYQLPGKQIVLPGFYNSYSESIKSGGIEIQGLSASPIPRRKDQANPVLEVYELVPNDFDLPTKLSMRVNLQIIVENIKLEKLFRCLELEDSHAKVDPENELLTPALLEALGDLPLIHPVATVFSNKALNVEGATVVENGNIRNEAKAYSVIIGTNLLEHKQVLEDVTFALKDDGFIISREPKNFSKKDITHPSLVLVTLHRTENETIVMLNKLRKQNPVFVKINDDPEFSWLPQLQSTLNEHDDVVVYSEHDQISGLTGFMNCLKNEPEVTNVRAVFIVDSDKSFNSNDQTFIEQLNKNLVINIYKNNQWGTYRHLCINAEEVVNCEHVFLGQLTSGDLSSLRWLQGPLNGVDTKSISPDQKIVEVHYSALNFKDIMIASGKLTAEVLNDFDGTLTCDIGMEFAGVDQYGNRITGIAVAGGLTSRFIVNGPVSWKIPDEWSMEDAVTVPVVYATLLYGLCIRGNMQKGESILIHSGLGGVGQAAIWYCLFHGLTIFTTVGSEERKKALKKIFPQLPDSHIGNSHDTSFEEMVMTETKGRGVDLVLNSLAEEKLIVSARCLAQGGRMIEIGKYDFTSNNMLNLLLLKKEASFHGVMLDQFFTRNSDEMVTLSRLMKKGFDEGSIKPLERHVFKYDEIEQAFRFMAGGKHLGKVVIKIRQEEKTIDPTKLHSQLFPALPRFFCDPKKSYIIIGGLGGFGLELADWLSKRGAKKLILSSKRGFTSGYQKRRVSLWENYGITVHVTTVDISSKAGCTEVIRQAEKLGPVDAIFNLAVCLKDAIFANQTVDTFKASLTPKAYVTKHLDELTRQMCPNMRYFVVFSSVSCGKGNAGQTNYGMANSIMERICEARKRDGYPGKAIQWGAVGDVGLLSQMVSNNAAEINIGGTLLQKISSCLQIMDTLLENSSPIVSSIVVAEKIRSKNSGESVIEAVTSIIGITDIKSVSFYASLAELGMDSMTAVEIKQKLESQFDIFMSPKEIRTLTLSKLQDIQNSKECEETALQEVATDMEQTKTFLFTNIPHEPETLILVPKMASKVSESEKAPTIFIIPGIEGFVNLLEPFSQKLKAHVYGLQFNHAEAPDTILEMAQIKLSLAENYLSKNEPFHIIAYSYGVVEAIELVSLLEARGYIGTLYCIDGAPSVANYVADTLGKTQSEIETNTLVRLLIVYNVPLTEVQNIALDYQKCKNIEEKIERTYEVFGNVIPLSSDYFRDLITGTISRIMAVRHYKPSYQKLKSDVILIKPTVPTFRHGSEDFGLSELCEKTVPLYTIEGDHTSILLNDELATYINSKL